MPQNFNIRPYNDDFDEKKHYYRVLFRPSVAVQARELTQSQSILQQQIKFLGDSIYKHGSMVIPGQVATDPKSSYVRLKATYGTLGPDPIPINLNIFKNQIIQGQTTGLKAQVVYSVAAENTDSPTLYVKYLNSGITGQTVFASDEVLTLENSSTGLAEVETNAPTGFGISAQIDEGVYYIWGFFVRVEKQYILLSKYTNVVNARIGLQIVESIITPEDDITLTDNAYGSTNYAAPGAHRYKIDLNLVAKPIAVSDDENFVELVRLINSVTQSKVTTDTYSILAKELAQRMNDANGDFAVRNFAIDIREHLDASFVTQDFAVGASVAVDDTPGPAAPAKLVLGNTASAVNDAYNGFSLYLSNGSGAGQRFTIVDYVGSTKTAILDADYNPNQVADTTTVYIISDLSKVNRGVNPPSPYGDGDAAKLAVGLEAGRAYVDGSRIDTLSTTYVDLDKARQSAQTINSQIPTLIGNYILAKNVKNLPLSAATVPNNFLTINFSNRKANGSFSSSANGIGTARVHAVEFHSGVNPADTTAIFKLFLFDIVMKPGETINNARSFFLENELTHNNNGNSLNAWGDVCATFDATNINGTGLIAGATITGPSGIGTEILAYYDPINNIIVTEPNSTNGLQILTSGTFTAPSSTSGQVAGRRQIFNAASSCLVYRMPQPLVKTIRASDTSVRTNYYTRKMFEAQRNGSGQYIFTSSPSAPFAGFSNQDYLACIVSSSNSAEIGKFIDLSSYVDGSSFGGSPANTTLTFAILTGLGSTSGTIIKLMATVFKTAASEKLKAATDAQIAYPNPTSVMSLEKADAFEIVSILDSGNPGVDADENNPAHLDIKSRYVLDTGQRDYYYDVGRVSLAAGAPPPAGRILIKFKYYAHSGSGDYFSVDSYLNQVDYAQIPVYGTSDGRFLPLRDCLDFRPRKEDQGLGFAGTGGSYSAPLRPNNTVITDFQYYLGRIDKIYLDQYGNFNVIKGTASINPVEPADPLDGMMLYTIKLNPYTLTAKDLVVKATKNPRFTMHDIGKLQERIEKLEYYVNLSQLEQRTASFQITDTKTGLDRFKNGFVVDNFSGHSVGNVFDPNYRCSIDPTQGILRPTFTQSVNSMNFNANASSHYANRCDIALLPYTETVSIEQLFATDVMNVNPFAVFTYTGDLALIPPTDTWKDTIQRPAINLTDTTAMDGYKYSTDWSGTTWGDWQQNWVGQPTSQSSSNTRTETTSASLDQIQSVINGPGTGTATTTFTDVTVTTSQQIGQTRTGTQTRTLSELSQQVNNSLVDTSLSPYIRSRRIKIVGRHLKPGARLYPFFDSVDVSAYCRPYQDPQLTPTLTDAAWTQMDITWGGDFNPQDNFNVGTTSDTGDTGNTANLLVGALNAPIYADASGTTTLFFEIPCTSSVKFRVGNRPFRLTSSAINALTADAYGDSNYNASGIVDQYQETITSIITPKIETKQLTDTRVITQSLGSTTSTSSNTTISATATQTIIPNGGPSVTWDPPAELFVFNPIPFANFQHTWTDPLAQSFLVKEQGGMFVTKVDVYFQTADENVPITMQIRSIVNGYPSQEVVPFSEKTLYPNNPVLSGINRVGAIDYDPPYTAKVINTSDDASVATSFVFDSPIYLNDGTEYAFVLIANSIKYTVYTAKLGGTVVGSTNIVSTPPYLGNLFKSQNASTWVADPSQNIKFTVHKAQFDTQVSGEIYFTNSSVQTDTLQALPFQTVAGSNLVRVLHNRHGMPKGQYVNSVVNINNVAPGTYNGLTASQLTGTFSIDNVDLNSYTITVSGSPASSTSRVGPDGVTATKNLQYDSMCTIINSLTPSGTSIDWYMKTTTGKSVHNNAAAIQEPYSKDASWLAFQPNMTNDFTAPRMIASDINEETSIVGATAYDRKSYVIKGVLSTTTQNLTPQVDLNRVAITTINNQIDDPTFANTTIQAMDQGVSVTSNSTDFLKFDCQVIVSVLAVTGGQYTVNETVLGARSGAQATVVSWDSVNLVLKDVTGKFVETEAISGSAAIGTITGIEYVNTITNPNGILDFSGFLNGFSMTIVGAPANTYDYSSPVTILNVSGNQIMVDTGTAQSFVTATNQANVTLTMYGRYVAESGPSRCIASSRYITRQFNLADPANSLHVFFTINRPPGSFIDVYYRTLKTNSTQPFDTLLWKPLELDSTVDSDESSNPNEFKEYAYIADNIGSYTAFAVKVVMRGGNSAQVPKIKDFRGIALAE